MNNNNNNDNKGNVLQLSNNNDQPQIPKDVYVVNDETDLGLFMKNIEYFAKTQKPVAVHPNKILLETLSSTIREYDYFATMQYKADMMTHRMVTVLPKLNPMTDFIDDDEKDFEYPEK